MCVGAELTLIGFEEVGAVGGPGRGLEVEDLKLAVTAHQQVYLTCQDVTILLQGHVHFSLDNAPHLVLVLVEVIHDLLKSGLASDIADRTHVTQTEESETALKQCANKRLVQRIELVVQRNPVDFLNSLVDEEAEEDHRRPRGGEVILTEELVLPWACLVYLQVAGKAVGAFDRHPISQLETLRSQQVLLHVWPLGESLPDWRSDYYSSLCIQRPNLSGPHSCLPRSQ